MDDLDPANYTMKPPKTRVVSQPNTPIDEQTLSQLDKMDATALKLLIQRVSGAMWGVGLKTQEQRDEAILLKLSILALTSEEAKDVVATAKEYFDRSRGKPVQSVDINGKIGIVQIVAEMGKRKPAITIDAQPNGVTD